MTRFYVGEAWEIGRGTGTGSRGLYFSLYSFSEICSISHIGTAFEDWTDDIIEWSKPCFELALDENLLYIL